MVYGMMASTFLIGAFLLVCVGIIGEYVGRVYDEVRRRPLSLINQVHRIERTQVQPSMHIDAGFNDAPMERNKSRISSAA